MNKCNFILFVLFSVSVVNYDSYAKDHENRGHQMGDAHKENFNPGPPAEVPKAIEAPINIDVAKPVETPVQNKVENRPTPPENQVPVKQEPAPEQIINDSIKAIAKGMGGEAVDTPKPKEMKEPAKIIVPPAPVVVPEKTIEVKKTEERKDKFDRQDRRDAVRQQHHEKMHDGRHDHDRDHGMQILKVLPDILLSITPGFEERDRIIVQKNKERHFSRDIADFKRKIAEARKTKVLVLYGDEFLLNIRLEMMMGIAGLQLTVLNPTERTFEKLSYLTNLKSLTLIGDDMYDEYLEYLLPLRGLRILNIEKTAGFTEQGLNEFFNEMPGLRIIW